MKRKTKVIATYIVVVGMVFIFLFDIAAALLAGHLEARYPVAAETFARGGARSRFHFLNTENSDCILLESDGNFALVDSGWGSDNPNPAAHRPGHEQRVIDYLKRVAADENGIVTLDFVLPTHYHYDHAGGFAQILSDPAIRVGTVYLRPLPKDSQLKHELEHWDTAQIRRRIEDTAQARGFSIVERLPDKPFAFGSMTLRFLNTAPKLRGENDRSTIVLANYGRFRALLAGDITATHGLERDIAAQAGGPVDLLKLPHHGYAMSSSAGFLRKLRPRLAVVTNGIGQVYPNVKWNLALVSRTPLLSSVQENGLIITVLPNGEMLASGDLHMGK